VTLIDDGHITFRVFCRERGGALDQSIPYGLAVTIEAGEGIAVYQEVRQRLGIHPSATFLIRPYVLEHDPGRLNRWR
jgi:hypothetical protein